MNDLNPDKIFRTRTSLNGAWEYAESPGPPPSDLLPTHISWNPHPVPIPRSLLPENAPSGFLRIPLSLPATEQRYWVRLDGVGGRAVYYLNGRRIYASLENFLAVEFDLTDRTDSIENELAIWCGPHEHLLAADDPAGLPAYLAPAGSVSESRRRGPYGDVWLERGPAVSIPDCAVRSLVHRNTLEADITLENRTLLPVQAELHLRIQDDGNPVKQFEKRPVVLAPGVLTTLRARTTWGGTLLWTPQDPHLYTMEASLEQDGQLLDIRTVRFGWREIKLERGGLLLNGQPIDFTDAPLRAYATTQEAAADFRSHRVIRLESPPRPEILDAADEAGVLLEAASAINGSGLRLQADHPTFLQACEDHLRAFVRRDRSHPSIAAWRLDCAMNASPGYEGYLRALPGLRNQVRALDPGRP